MLYISPSSFLILWCSILPGPILMVSFPDLYIAYPSSRKKLLSLPAGITSVILPPFLKHSSTTTSIWSVQASFRKLPVAVDVNPFCKPLVNSFYITFVAKQSIQSCQTSRNNPAMVGCVDSTGYKGFASFQQEFLSLPFSNFTSSHSALNNTVAAGQRDSSRKAVSGGEPILLPELSVPSGCCNSNRFSTIFSSHFNTSTDL